MGIKDLFKKFLPTKIQELLPQAQELLQDDSIAKNLVIAAEELEKELETAAENPAAGKPLKNAFNDAAMLVSVGKKMAEKQDVYAVSMITGTKLYSGKNRIRENMETLKDSFKAKEPATLAFVEAVKGNTRFNTAIQSLVSQTNGKLFKVEDGENGQGIATELITGQNLAFVIEQKHYAEIKARLLDKAPPKPPNTGPGCP